MRRQNDGWTIKKFSGIERILSFNIYLLFRNINKVRIDISRNVYPAMNYMLF